MAPIRIPAFEGCRRALLGSPEGCEHGCVEAGGCPFLDYPASETDRVLQLRLRARAAKDSRPKTNT